MIPAMYVERLGTLLEELEHRFTESQTGDSVTESDFPYGAGDIPEKQLDTATQLLAERLSRHYPFHHPRYAGQMLKPPHPAAWLAYAAAMTINPNNHALDGGPESSRIEKEVIRELMDFVGFPQQGLGHLTSSGTIANLEALWIARELHPDRPVGISSQSHYTHHRMCRVLRHSVIEIPDGDDGMADPTLLDASQPLPGTIVVTLGTTGFGMVEPLQKITKWAKKNGVRVHVDAAYGGFFRLLQDSGLIDPDPWKALPEADSIAMDPHKHGLQPYGCGSVLFRDPAVGRFYKHDSPYTYFTSDELHLGEISLECSRSGAAAIALWFTLKLLSLDSDGLGRILADCREAALQLSKALQSSGSYRVVMPPDLDIVVFLPETPGRSYSETTRLSRKILSDGMAAGSGQSLYLSSLNLAAAQARLLLPDLEADQESVTVLRSVMMKPEHLGFVPEMMSRLERLYRNAR